MIPSQGLIGREGAQHERRESTRRVERHDGTSCGSAQHAVVWRKEGTHSWLSLDLHGRAMKGLMQRFVLPPHSLNEIAREVCARGLLLCWRSQRLCEHSRRLRQQWRPLWDTTHAPVETPRGS